MREMSRDEVKKIVKNGVPVHQVVFTYTSPIDYDMSRAILLEEVEGISYDEYLLLDGYHCSCYDFDDTEWTGMVYKVGELKKLARADYNKEDHFWQMISDYFQD